MAISSATHRAEKALLLIVLALLAAPVSRGQSTQPLHQAGQEYSDAVDVQEDVVYLGKGRSLVVLDVSNPAAPDERGRVALPAQVRDIFAEGKYVYVADREGGLRIVDASAPAHPVEIGAVAFEDRAEGLAKDGDYVYVAARTAGLQVVDVSDPAAPKVVGSYATDEQAADVAVSGELAHVAATYGGHRIIDISDPTQPREIGSSIRDSYDQGFAWGLAVKEPFVYVANVEIGLRRVDIAEVDLSTENNKAPTVALIQAVHRPADVTVAGAYAYLADQEAGMRMFYAGRQDTLFEVSLLPTSGRVMDVAVSGNYAYAAAKSAGLRVIDVSDPFDPTEVGSWDPDMYAVDVASVGTMAYVADRENGLWTVDLSDPKAPVKKGLYAGHVEQVAASGDHAYIAGGKDGLRIVDVSDPARPREVGAADAVEEAVGISVSENYVMVAEKEAGVHIYDVSTPSQPKKVGDFEPNTTISGRFYNNPIATWKAVVSGSTAYVLCDDGIRAVDISNPVSPKEVGFFETSERAVEAVIVEDRAFVAFDDGFRMVDISDPANMRQIRFFGAPSFVTDLAVSESRVYILDLRDGLGMIERSDLTDAAQEVRFVQTMGRPLGLTVAGNHVYVATGPGGLQIVDVNDPVQPRQASASN